MAPRKPKPEIIRPTEPAAVRAAITNALQMLAGVCDWAATRDDMGFNSPDAATGHALADYSARAPLTDIELAIGFRLLQKYQKRQLAGAGIVLPDAATLAAIIGTTIDLERPKQQFEGAIRIGRDDDGQEVVLVIFDYNPARQTQLKHCVRPFGYARFERNPSGHGGFWSAPLGALHAIAACFPTFARTAEVGDRLTSESASAAAPGREVVQPRGTSFRMREVQAEPAAPVVEQAAPAPRTERPLGTITLDGCEVVVAIERLWEVDRAQAVRAKDLCKAYRDQHGGRGFDPATRSWRLARTAALPLTKALTTFAIADAVQNLAAEQLHGVRHAA